MSWQGVPCGQRVDLEISPAPVAGSTAPDRVSEARSGEVDSKLAAGEADNIRTPKPVEMNNTAISEDPTPDDRYPRIGSMCVEEGG